MAENKEQAKTEAPKKSLPLGLILQLSFVVVNLGVTGLGAFWVYSGTMGWSNPAITEAQLQAEREALEEKQDEQGAEAGPLVYTMDKFTVNLGGEPKRTIRLEVNLEMLGKDGFEEIINSDNRARARDRIVRLLNDKTFTDLESIQGKLFLKDKIASEINGILDKGVVKDIYFSEFVVQ
jgi:flagellar FliL protein